MPRPFLDTSPRRLIEAFSWNVATAHALTRAAVPIMLESGGGAVVGISSMMGRTSGRGYVAYGTAKAGLSHWTRLAAQDLAPRIRVERHRGRVDRHLRARHRPAGRRPAHRRWRRAPRSRRIGDPEEIAAAVLFLASAAGGYVTGKVVEVDGGIEQPNLDLGLPDSVTLPAPVGTRLRRGALDATVALALLASAAACGTRLPDEAFETRTSAAVRRGRQRGRLGPGHRPAR